MTCAKCGGVGYFYIDGDGKVPSVKQCTCQLKIDIVDNVNRGWKGLSSAPAIPSSELLDKTQSNVWVTTSYPIMRAHMRHVAMRQSPLWRFLVCSDVDLMTAWLSSTFLKRADVFDVDVAMASASISSQMHSLVDYIDPPHLLVVQLGVKSARNSATPEVLLETLRVRISQEKPTWIFDQPDQQFNHTHLAYSPASEDLMQGFDRVILKGSKKSAAVPTFPVGSSPTPISRPHPPVEDTLRPAPKSSSAMDSLLERMGESKKKKTYKR